MSCRRYRSRAVWNGKSPRWRATTESTGKVVSKLLIYGCIIETEYNHDQPERGTLCKRKPNIAYAGKLLIRTLFACHPSEELGCSPAPLPLFYSSAQHR